MLCKKLGKYYESVKMFMKAMREQVDMTMIKYELYEAKQKEWMSHYPIFQGKLIPNCHKIDSILKKVQLILIKNSSEVDYEEEELIWYDMMDNMFAMKMHPTIASKKYCREFFEKRIQVFMEEMVMHIPFKNFVEHCAKHRKEMRYKDLQVVLTCSFSDQNATKIIIKDVKKSIYTLDANNFKEFNMKAGYGVRFRQLRCHLCKRFIDGSSGDYYEQNEEEEHYETYDMQNDQIRVFKCAHNFHDKCVNRYYEMKESKFKENQKKTMRSDQKCPVCHKRDTEIVIEPKGSPLKKGGS